MSQVKREFEKLLDDDPAYHDWSRALDDEARRQQDEEKEIEDHD